MKPPSPIDLLNNKGNIGEVLRAFRECSPPEILADAEKRDDPWGWLAGWIKNHPMERVYAGTMKAGVAEIARRKAEGFKRTGKGVYSAPTRRGRKNKAPDGVRAVRFHRDPRDPDKLFMRMLSDAPWPEIFRKTFEAASSQRKAFIVLGQVARKGGSISSHDWHLRMRSELGKWNKKKAAQWMRKHMASILSTPRGRRWLLDDKVEGLSAPRAIRAEAGLKFEAFYRADVRRLGRANADRKWKGTGPLALKLGANSDKIAEAMTSGWLAVGDKGFPGLCFMSDNLVAELLGHTLPLPSLLSIGGWKTVRTVRERIGLKKAPILFKGMKKDGERSWGILDWKKRETGHWISVKV